MQNSNFIIANESVGIGGNARQVTSNKSIVLGYSSLPRDTQHGPYSIHIGHNTNRVLGSSSIAIGPHYGTGVSQVPNNCIVLSANGTGTQIIPSTTGCFHITPLRSATGLYPMTYNSVSSELTYGSGVETLSSTAVPIDTSGANPTTQFATTGTFTLGIGTSNYQFKTMYASPTTTTINFSTLGGSGSNNTIWTSLIYNNILYIGGTFTSINSVTNNYIARYDLLAKSWLTPLGSGLNGNVYALAVDTTRNTLVIGGSFTTANGISSNRIVIYNITTGVWSALGNGLNNDVNALAMSTDASDNIYVTGAFTTADNVTNNYIAVYNFYSSSWQTSLGSGLNGIGRDVVFYSNRVYVSGAFTTAGGITVNKIAIYNIALKTWNSMGTGLNGDGYTLFFDDSTETIFIGGAFTSANSITNNYIARWHTVESTWASPMSAGLNTQVWAISLDTSRRILYIGGLFTLANGLPNNYLARYDLTNDMWVVAQQCFGTGMNNRILSMSYDTVTDNMYICGDFTLTNGTTTNRITCLQLPKTRINGPFWYKMLPYSFMDMDANASIECMYMNHIASWAITTFSGVNLLT